MIPGRQGCDQLQGWMGSHQHRRVVSVCERLKRRCQEDRKEGFTAVSRVGGMNFILDPPKRRVHFTSLHDHLSTLLYQLRFPGWPSGRPALVPGAGLCRPSTSIPTRQYRPHEWERGESGVYVRMTAQVGPTARRKRVCLCHTPSAPP